MPDHSSAKLPPPMTRLGLRRSVAGLCVSRSAFCTSAWEALVRRKWAAWGGDNSELVPLEGWVTLELESLWVLK